MHVVGELAAIWRYPVKSLASQALDSAAVQADGIEGDRRAALFVESGHARAGKTYRGKEHNLLHTLAHADGAAELAGQRGVRTSLRAEPNARYFDDAPVSLVFDAWIAQVERALGMTLDPLRWRPNLYARAAAGFACGEEELVGRVVEAGTVVLRVRDTIKRCVTTTYDVRSGHAAPDVLSYVAQKRANVMGVYCEVEFAGTLRVGDALRLRAF